MVRWTAQTWQITAAGREAVRILSGARLLLANSIQIGHVIRIENVGEGEDKKMRSWKEVQRTTYSASELLTLSTLYNLHAHYYEIIVLRYVFTDMDTSSVL